MQIQYLGQAGLLVQGNQSQLLIDPYLSDFVVTGGYGSAAMFSRNFPPPVNPEELTKIDVVFVTHDHADHCDLDTLKAVGEKNPRCMFIGPAPARDHLRQLDSIAVQLFSSFAEAKLAGMDFSVVPAAHPGLEYDPRTMEPLAVGYVIRVDGVVLYHSGDTVLYDGMKENILAPFGKVDIACLPVNGRDEQREAMGIVGNLNAGESVELALSLGATHMIPMHNDLFSVNQDDPDQVKKVLRAQSRLKILEMAPGETLRFP
jgi:L-ascorbate metabolism protein UlaG (beta-lactamase superfamily)